MEKFSPFLGAVYVFLAALLYFRGEGKYAFIVTLVLAIALLIKFAIRKRFDRIEG